MRTSLSQSSGGLRSSGKSQERISKTEMRRRKVVSRLVFIALAAAVLFYWHGPSISSHTSMLNAYSYATSEADVKHMDTTRKLQTTNSVDESAEKQERKEVVPAIVLPNSEDNPKITGNSDNKEVGKSIPKLHDVVYKTPLDKLASDAWAGGEIALREAEKERALLVERAKAWDEKTDSWGDKLETCKVSIVMSGDDIRAAGGIVNLPCGLSIGSSFTFTGVVARDASDTSEKGLGFIVELQGLPVVDGEDAPRILHLNPRVTGDWSGRPVIEHNTFYRNKWDTAQRCDGTPSTADEEKVDGLPWCEHWTQGEQAYQKSGKSSGWLQRLIHNSKEEKMEWSYPFHVDRMFVLTVRAGFEGFHVSVDGLHVTSFPYRSKYMVEEAIGIHLGGDITVESFTGTSLPLDPPLKRAVLEKSDHYKAPPLKEGPLDLFIGVLSASTYFSERLAVRKTWLQYPIVRSGGVVVRFFIGLHPSKQVNVEAIKERDFYGDMVIVPFIDQYDLVVLKSIAICEWGIKNTNAKYIMKADDDNFVRIGRVLVNIRHVNHVDGLYMGSMNEFHRPLRSGKWAVTYEEWPEKAYPPYANGPGYILSRDVAAFIVNLKDRGFLRLFKMEDVSVGMWVVQYGVNKTVHYIHNWKFTQFGCMEDYITAHYQAPKQMFCLWSKLQRGDSTCCDA